MMTSQYRTRTVTLRRARFALAFSIVMAAVSFGLLFLLAGSGAWSGVAFAAISLVLSCWRALRWHRAIRKALTSPDEYRWTP
jgi:hypothetical protein